MKTLLTTLTLILTVGVYAQEIIVVPPPDPAVAVPLENGVTMEMMKVVEDPDVEAEFKGGMEGLQKFISENIQYPQDAITHKIEGKVYLSFVVLENGKVTEIIVIRGVDTLLDREAKRLIATMPAWKPGEKNGKPVTTRLRIPINFTL